MQLLGCGAYTPPCVVTNHELSLQLDTSDAWIVTRTGIEQRHIAKDETVVDLGTQAAQKALASANLSPHDISFIITATTTNPEVFPSVATQIQARLGCKEAFAFDVQAVCSGFIYALSIAQGFSLNHKFGLVIGTEVMSRLLDWNDRSTCVLFGDGAGAVVVGSGDHMLSCVLGSDGSLHDALYANPYVHMNGQQVFRYGIDKMQASLSQALLDAKCSLDDLRYLVPHQANFRMIKTLCENLKIPLEKAVMTMNRHANTSAASIPLALSTIWDQLEKDDLIAMTAAGAGMTWGSLVMRIS